MPCHRASHIRLPTHHPRPSIQPVLSNSLLTVKTKKNVTRENCRAIRKRTHITIVLWCPYKQPDFEKKFSSPNELPASPRLWLSRRSPSRKLITFESLFLAQNFTHKILGVGFFGVDLHLCEDLRVFISYIVPLPDILVEVI